MNKLILSSDKIKISSLDVQSLNQISKFEFVDKVFVYPDIYQKEHKDWPSGIMVTTKKKIMPTLTGSRLGCGMLGIKLGKLNLDEKEFLGLSDSLISALPANKKQKKHNFSLAYLKSKLDCLEKNDFSFSVDSKLIDSYLFDYQPLNVSNSVLSEGANQLGLPGLLGNHFIELQKIENICDSFSAKKFGLKKGDYFLLLHFDSYNLNLKLENSFREDKYLVLDEKSNRGVKFHNISMFMERYCSLNRLVVADSLLRKIESVLSTKPEMLYDSTHESLNKIEVDGEVYWRHHAGAAFASNCGSKRISKKYRGVGQPLFLPGSMGSDNFILASQNTYNIFEAINHGTGRSISKTESREKFKNSDLKEDFKTKGVVLRQLNNRDLISQLGDGYKSISDVDNIVVKEGFAKNVAQTRAKIIIKG